MAHPFKTRDCVSMYCTAAVDSVEACFLDLAAMVQLLIQLEYMRLCVCVCVCGDDRGFLGGGVRVMRLRKQQSSKMTALTEPFP